MKQSKPRQSSKSKKALSEPSAEKVSIIASGLQDIYSVTDNVIGFALNIMGKQYPQGMFELDDKKAEKMGRALSQMNTLLPNLAEHINKYAAPATFFSILLSDIALKGAVIYGITKQTPNRHLYDTRTENAVIDPGPVSSGPLQ